MPLSVVAQTSQVEDKSGLPAFRTYFSPEDYSAYHQIWAITSDDNNRIYVGTAEGVSVYDNADWRLITTPSNTTVRSMAYGFRNQVYVGLQGDIGVITPDSTGQLGYRSILREGVDVPDFGNVWETHATVDGVYFQSSQYLAYWNGDSLQWVNSESGYHTSFKSGSSVIVREKSVGLIEYDGVEIRKVPHSEYFSDKRVFVFESVGDDRWLVGTRDSGFYNLTQHGINKIVTEIDNLVVDNWIYGGIRLSDKLIGVYTLGAGLLVIDTDGELVRSLSLPTEISDRYIISAHLDGAGSVWLGTMNSGIERYDSNFIAVSMFDESIGLNGYIYDVQSNDSLIVVSTGSGLHISKRDKSTSDLRYVRHFKRIEAVPIAWESQIGQNSIYAVSDAGVFRIGGSKVDTLSREQSFSIDLYTDKNDILFIGGKGQIQIMSVDPVSGAVNHQLSIPIDGEVDILDWDSKQNVLWANVKNDKIVSYKISYNLTRYSIEGEHVYKASDSDVNKLFEFEGSRYYTTRKSINKYSPKLKIFERDEMCSYLCQDEILGVDVSSEGRIWVVYSDSVLSGYVGRGIYDWQTHKDLNFHKSSTGAVKLTGGGSLFISERSRLFRYDTTVPSIDQSFIYSVVINEVRPARTDTAYYGVFTDGGVGIGSFQPDYLMPTIPYEQRDITIRASSTSYLSSGDVHLYYKYEHNSDSTWVAVEDNTFTVSPSREGNYTLNVRAVDEVGRESTLANYSFIISPPWFRTWYAYTIYVIISVFVILITKKYHRLRQAQKQAEEQAKELERERVVVRKLQEANVRLKEANKLKDEFLATTSHELRTPLTAILGFTSVLKEEVPLDADYREFLEIIEDSGGRLMDTLNSLLDLAKIRAGILEITLENVELNQLVDDVSNNLKDRANKKDLYLRVEPAAMPVKVTADMYGLRRVLYNLVSNAIKFTNEGGVTVSVRAIADQVILSVSDTGVGIDKSFVPKIFDEFMQESDGLSRAYEGSGVGLAISAQLIRMMGARLDVDSCKGEGSIFEIAFSAQDGGASQKNYKSDSTSGVRTVESQLRSSGSAPRIS